MEALFASPVTLVPEVRPRAAVFIRLSGSVVADLKTRSAVVGAARGAGLEIAELVEVKGNPKEARARLILSASGGLLDVVVVNALRDLGHKLFDAIATALDLFAVGTKIHSIEEEQWLNLDSDLDLVTSVCAWMLTEEKRRKARAIREGQARAHARSPNETGGRPRKVVDVQRALALVAGGLSIAKAARALGCSRSHLQRAFMAHELASVPANVAVSPLVSSGSQFTEELCAGAT